MRIFTTLVLLAFIFNLNAQTPVTPSNVYGIKDPGTETARFCGQCQSLMENMPPEISMGFYVDDNKDLIFAFSDLAYFNKIFTGPFDGIAVDIISRDQYPCDKDNNYPGSGLHKGYLTKPIYLPEIKTNLTVQDGWAYVKLMKVPAAFQKKDVEFNLVILKNKYFCWYNTFFDIKSQHWGLLDMGMYKDTLTEESLKEKSNSLGKRLTFEIPFKKDKYEYVPKDIKPLYDSLKLTNFEIRSISIHSFSSIEGSTERNLELQQKRGESIVKAIQTLQSLQTDSVPKRITSSENWVEFYMDIIEGRFSYLKDLSKVEIKQKLNTDKTLAASMESILRKHRKAIVILELEPKSTIKEKDPEKLKAMFEASIAEKNINQALELQKEIFKRIQFDHIPESFLEKLEVPEQVEYGLLKNSLAAYKYQENVIDLFEALKQFKKLSDLIPNNHRVRYNLCVLQLKGWLSSEIVVDPLQLKKEIESLNKTPIDKRLIKRLLINFHIINTELLMSQRKYAEKDQSLKFIYDNYVFLSLAEEDILSLAQYFVEFGHLDWAEKLVFQYAKKIGAGENLLFYYLNLTLTNEERTSSKEYRSIMLNALDVNKKRFCNLFNKSGKDGGITFQLLDNEYLKKTYCENCNASKGGGF